MKPTLPRFAVLAFVALTLGSAGSALGGVSPRHFGLAKSVPADKATVHDVRSVTLWFTEAPAEGTVSIRLVAPSGEPVPTAAPAQDPESDKAFVVTLTDPLAPGAYHVAWRGMGDDGHVVRGDLSFTVAAH